MDARETFSCTNTISTRKIKNKNQRRFSGEQIKSLESMFESESRLEPRKKVQLAKELGLQPRQVAIWFQNKRARWKSKQLERDYHILLSNYNSLASRFETLKKEKHGLLVQLQKLNKLIGLSGEELEQSSEKAASENNIERNAKLIEDRGKSGLDNKGSLSKSEHVGMGVVSDKDSSVEVGEYFGLEEEPKLLRISGEPADGSLTSQEEWGNLGSNGLFDQRTEGSQWWDFWG